MPYHPGAALPASATRRDRTAMEVIVRAPGEAFRHGLHDGAGVRSRGDEILRRCMFQPDHAAADLDRPWRSVRKVGCLRRHLQRAARQ